MRAAAKSSNETPLARWLRETGTKQVTFADACERDLGFRVHPVVISRWVRGESTPNQHSRALIARVTGGAVPVESWLRPSTAARGAA